MSVNPEQFIHDLKIRQGRMLGAKVVESLKKNHFDATFFESGSEAVNSVMDFIKPGYTVAFGGSQTIKQLGLDEKIRAAGGIILDHNAPELSGEEKMEVMRKQQVCDVFICSSNAVSLQGELVNVDGNGNRISAMIFGPGKVIVLAGVNKICSDEQACWERIRTVAAPLNFLRLNRPNPCTREGLCMDCQLPTRGCNAYLVLRKKPSLTDFSVYIINETLGF